MRTPRSWERIEARTFRAHKRCVFVTCCFEANVFGRDSKARRAEEKEMKDPPKRKERRGEAERKKRGPWRSLHLYKQGAPKKQIFCCDARIHDAVTGPTNHGRTGRNLRQFVELSVAIASDASYAITGSKLRNVLFRLGLTEEHSLGTNIPPINRR